MLEMKFVLSPLVEDIFYADLVDIKGRRWVVAGFGKSRATENLGKVISQDDVSLGTANGWLMAGRDTGARGAYAEPGAFDQRKVDVFAFCLTAEETIAMIPPPSTIRQATPADIATVYASYPYPGAGLRALVLLRSIGSSALIARLDDPARRTSRFMELADLSVKTQFVFIPFMPTESAKSALYQAY